MLSISSRVHFTNARRARRLTVLPSLSAFRIGRVSARRHALPRTTRLVPARKTSVSEVLSRQKRHPRLWQKPLKTILKDDSLYSRETECGARHRPCHRCDKPASGLFGGQRLSGDVDLRSSVYAERAPRLWRAVETLGVVVAADDTGAFRHKTHRGRRHTQAVRYDRASDAECRRHRQLR